MKYLKISTLLTAAIALGGCATTSSSSDTAATPVQRAQCSGMTSVDADVATLYNEGAVTGVRPVYHREFRARAIQPRHLVGARFDVPAPRSMTAGYAERVLSCHAANGAPSANDPLRVAGVYDVDVRAVGTRLRIEVVGQDREAGRAIFDRARALEERRTRVDVQQVAAVPAASTSM